MWREKPDSEILERLGDRSNDLFSRSRARGCSVLRPQQVDRLPAEFRSTRLPPPLAGEGRDAPEGSGSTMPVFLLPFISVPLGMIRKALNYKTCMSGFWKGPFPFPVVS